MNKEAIYKIVDKAYIDIYRDYYGCEMLVLYGNKGYEFETLEEEMEAFLYLFKKLVDDELIFVYPPTNREKEKELAGEKFWDTNSDKMIEYIRSILPKNLKALNGGLDDKDCEREKFWYCDFPTIYWTKYRYIKSGLK